MNTGLINITGVNYLVATPVPYWAHSGVSTCQGDLSTSHPNQQPCVSTPLWPIFNSGIYRAVSGTDHQYNLATSGLRGIIPTGLTKLSLQANLCLFNSENRNY